ncbi:helix-turn-helix domain-containing protein [Myceligenerans crystallogenes]|uniref:Resolvase HTH domain-containing protein n=1 Tax=Myceligenerans crystallogenes TaxID=316335 RepID=A0ABP4ZMC2_9MICO
MNATASKPRPGLVAAVAVAVISTVTAYLAMVAFGTDVLHMPAWLAFVCSGVFELSLVTVALLAREAARDNRPSGILLMLTWALSATSGVFAAWHEFVSLPFTEAIGAALFRFLTPLLAALMWHLALIGDRHLATGASWSGMRTTARMHVLFLATEDLYRIQADVDGSWASRRRLAIAARRRRKARAIALRSVAPQDMRAHCAAHVDAVKAQADADAELAALHVAHRARLAGVLGGQAPVSTTSADTQSPYAVQAAKAVSTEVAQIVSTNESTGSSMDKPVDPPRRTGRNRRGQSTRTTSTRTLDATMANEIVTRRAAGDRPVDIAAALGLGRSTVYKVLKNETTPDTTPATTTDTTTPAPAVLAEVN